MIFSAFLALCLVLFFSWFTFKETGFLIRLLTQHRILDRPNARSNHQNPTPRGGGIAIVDGLTIGFFALSLFAPAPFDFFTFWPFLLSLVGLAAVSFFDDVRSLPAFVRLGSHVVFVLFCLPLIQAQGLVFQGLLSPFWDGFFAFLAWVWFVNLTNFMDGIDGISGTHAFFVALGVALIALFSPLLPSFLLLFCAVILGVMIGFLRWNWHPAKIFMGDVGSIPLGFTLGFFLLFLAARGFWVAALLLPAYYLADSGITIARRLLRGEKIWQAHSQHFYQHAVRRGLTHDSVVRAIGFSQILLIVLALYSSLFASGFSLLLCLFLSFVEVGRLLWYLARR